MVVAEIIPLYRKFAVRIQQGQERGGESSDPAGRLGAHDPLCGNVHNAQILDHMGIIVAQYLIKNLRIGIQSGGKPFLVFFFTPGQSGQVFFLNKLKIHGKPPVNP